MENKICQERSINEIINAKEKAIIKLYAEQKHLDEEVVASVYFNSKLRNIIMDEESGLYLESPYYILERYSEYMVPVNLGIDIGSMILPNREYPEKLTSLKSAMRPKQPYYTVNDLLMQESKCWKLVFAQNNTHYFSRVEQYQFIADNLKNIIIAGTAGIGKSTLAGYFKELGIIPSGNFVNIDENGLVRKWLEKDRPFVEMGLLMIVIECPNTMGHLGENPPILKNNFTNIACYESPVSAEKFSVYKSRYKETNSTMLEASMKMKSLIEML